MIITVTFNPAIDRTIEVDKFVAGTVMRTKNSVTCAGGKGINVARALNKQGYSTKALLFSGGLLGCKLERLLEDENLDFEAVYTRAETRISFQIVEADGSFSNLNDQGGPITENELQHFKNLLRNTIKKGDILVASGSLPQGINDDIYQELTVEFLPVCSAVAIDADGAPLKSACKKCPTIIKPNEFELQRLAGRSFENREEMYQFLRQSQGRLAEVILVTLGDKGAFCAAREGLFYVPPLKVKAISTVGAGDSFLAGFLSLYEQGQGLKSCLAAAAATAAAKVSLPGTEMPDRQMVEELINEKDIVEIS